MGGTSVTKCEIRPGDMVWVTGNGRRLLNGAVTLDMKFQVINADAAAETIASPDFLVNINSGLASIGVQAIQTGYPQVCPDEWEHFQGNCYLFETTRRPWADQEAFCVSEGAHVTSVHSAEENAFVGEMMPPHSMQNGIFIGIAPGHQFNNPGTFATFENVWSDGSANDFTNWGSLLPNSIFEECAHMFNIPTQTPSGPPFFWNDMTCSSSFPTVCKKPAATATNCEDEAQTFALNAGDERSATCEGIASYHIVTGDTLCTDPASHHLSLGP
jgi:C-type mannose receptor